METYQPPLGLDERAVLPVHLVIESAGVTQIVTRTVPPPQGGRRGPAVHALSSLCGETHTQSASGSEPSGSNQITMPENAHEHGNTFIYTNTNTTKMQSPNIIIIIMFRGSE